MNHSPILEFVLYHPLALLGFLFIGAGAAIAAHVALKVLRSGLGVPRGAAWTMGVRIHLAYLANKDRQGWPAWPAHATWILFGVGLFALIIALAHLPD